MPTWEVPEDIVITGFSGKFPESDNILELWDNLMNKRNLLKDNLRWQKDVFGLPPKLGMLKDITRFDPTFFGVHAKQANTMDPQLRILLECTYEAIVDSGYDPAELSGSRTGVFVGVSHSETKDKFLAIGKLESGYGLLGCSFSMFANRISFTFNFTGPSFSIDTACASSLCAMNQAVLMMRTNQCDSAIVCGANVCINPITSRYFLKMKMLDPDGECRPFDASSNGYCRSETIGAVFLQRESQARRVYAIVSHIKTNTDGAKEEGITFPSQKKQAELMEAVYEEINVNPLDVHYVEAHGTGTKAGDPEEARAIAKVFCKNRNEPLLIGSIKGNIGHAEPGSGIGALGKVIMAMKERTIPPNIHYTNPNPDIEPLVTGKMKVITEPTPLKGEYVAVNNFGFGGVNVHILLKRPKEVTSPEGGDSMPLPRLVLWCDRTEAGVASMLKQLENTKVPEETYGFLQNLSKRHSMTHRGYTLLKKGPVPITTKTKSVSMLKRPVWFVFSGMGTQWPEMGKDLLQLEPFAKSIYHSAQVLKPYGIDLMSALSKVGDGSKSEKREIVPAFVTIAAIQVALVDTLRELEINPDGIVGHSVGELGCAYADGCLNAEQMVLSAYWRGKCVEEAGLIAGAMAAVGLTWEETIKKCPDGILPACNNSEDTVTVSGPVDRIRAFVKQLESENIFVREVDSCGYAFHCSYVNPAAPGLLNALEKLIPSPEHRSQRWICSSIPESNWHLPIAKHCSASYLVNNLVSSVLFREALAHVPSDAIVVEIGPHCLLQAILRRSLSEDCIFIPLMNKKIQNNLEYFLSSIGNLYNAGANPAVEKLYKKTIYPVPKEVPTVSPFITWEHSQSWEVAVWNQERDQNLSGGSEILFEIDISSQDSAYYFLTGHCIDGRTLFPASGYLTLAWKALAKTKGKESDQVPVEFEDFRIHRATILSKKAATKFRVSLLQMSGEFEINEGGTVAASGRIKQIEEVAVKVERFHKRDSSDFKLDTKDIYRELRLRGYEYGPSFQPLVEAESNGTEAKLKWDGKWESFLDGLLQTSILTKSLRALFLPTRIRNIRIDPRVLASCPGERIVPVFCNKYTNECVSLGIILRGLKASVAPRRQDQKILPILEKYSFVPHNRLCVSKRNEGVPLQEYIAVCSTLATRIFGASEKYKDQLTKLSNDFKEVTEEIVDGYLQSDNKSFVLLNAIKELSRLPFDKSFQENAKSVVSELQSNLTRDILSTILLSEEALRTCLDLVIENIPLNKLKALEISENNTIGNFVQHFLVDFNVHFNLDYTIACPDPDSFGDKIKTVQWDLISEPPNQMSNFDLIIAKDICINQELHRLLESALSLLKFNGFFLLIQRTKVTLPEMMLSELGVLNLDIKCDEEITDLINRTGFDLICKRGDTIASTLYLLRKTEERIPQSRHISVRNNDYTWVEELKKALYEPNEKEKGDDVLLVAEDTGCNGILGMVNCLRKETEGERIRCFFNASTEEGQLPPFSFTESAYKDVLRKKLVMNVFKDGQWGTFRHTSLETAKPVMTDHALASVQTRGDLSTLYWTESSTKYWDPSFKTFKNEDLHYTYYSALNFKDIMLATGKLPPDAISDELAVEEFILGMEYSGRTKSGKRIMGLLQLGRALSTVIKTENDFLWEVPSQWTLEEACTIPVAYCTAYYSLIMCGNLREGEKVLIHSGSGGVGQAAINIALSMNCEVFTSVGSIEKRNFLKQRYPQLTDRNICNSRDTSFEQQILFATNGYGVDVVLNSLSDEKLQASVRCLAIKGRFLEIGKYDSAMNNALGMAVLLKNISFHGIHVDQAMNEEVTTKAVRLIQEGIKSGVVQPLNFVVYTRDEIEQAFRFMASGRHIGKVLIKLREEESEVCTPPSMLKIPAIPRTICQPGKVYIICGGLGGFGLELANWLTTRGARNLVLTSKSGIKSGYQRLRLKAWREQGLNVTVSDLDASDYNQALDLVNRGKKFGEIGGIFNLAAVLRDGFLENLDEDDYRKAAEPKVNATHNLDDISRKHCRHLDWFVAFSSLSCGRGNAGQSNYGFANSVMERICEKRRKDGLPGLAIQWGAVGDVGLVFEMMGGNEVEIGGTLPQRINSCFSTLDLFIRQDQPVVSSFVPAKRKLKDNAMRRNLLDTVAHIFGIKDTGTLNPSITLGELGMDSLMGVEIKQTLEREYDMFLSVQEIRMLRVKQLLDIGEQSKTEVEVKSQPAKTSSASTINLKRRCLVPQQDLITLNNVEVGQPLFVVPSFKGTSDDFSFIAENVPFPVYGLQVTSKVPQSSIREIAAYYSQLIKSKLRPDEPCYILGHSDFGAVTALEVAIELTNGGCCVQKLFFLDDTSAFITAGKHTENNDLTEDEKMSSFIQQFVRVSHGEQLLQDLQKQPLMKHKIQHLASIITVATEFRMKDDVIFGAEAALHRIDRVIEYSSASKFNGIIQALTSADNVGLFVHPLLKNHFSPSKICEGDITVHKLEESDNGLLTGKSGLRVSSILSKERNLG